MVIYRFWEKRFFLYVILHVFKWYMDDMSSSNKYMITISSCGTNPLIDRAVLSIGTTRKGKNFIPLIACANSFKKLEFCIFLYSCSLQKILIYQILHFYQISNFLKKFTFVPNFTFL